VGPEDLLVVIVVADHVLAPIHHHQSNIKPPRPDQAGFAGARLFNWCDEMRLIFNHEVWVTCCGQEYDVRAWVRCPICNK